MEWLKKAYFVYIPKNQKAPTTSGWQNKGTSYLEAQRWVHQGHNIGLLHGKASGTMAVDIDDKTEFEKQFGAISQFLQTTAAFKSKKGYHLIYKWQEGLRNLKLAFGDFLYQNKVSLIPPSVADGVKRFWVNQILSPNKLPPVFLEYISSCLKPNNFQIEDYNKNVTSINAIQKGSRNVSLVKMAGAFRHIVQDDEVFARIVHITNRMLCNPPISYQDVEAMLRKQFNYRELDDLALKDKILHLLSTGEALHWKQLAQECKVQGGTIRKALKELTDSGNVLKIKKGCYVMTKLPKFTKAKDLVDTGVRLPYKVKYFNDIAYFNEGDLLLICGRSKIGKTHLALNFCKDFLSQGAETYYYYTESGGRFKKIIDILGGCEELNVAYTTEPERILLMPHSVTILDWLLVEDKAQTDIVFKRLSEEAQRRKGLLIVFMQLKEPENGKGPGQYFAVNMVKQFPALAARYTYDDEEGKTGHFIIDAVREPKSNKRRVNCVFDFETCLLTEQPEWNI